MKKLYTLLLSVLVSLPIIAASCFSGAVQAQTAEPKALRVAIAERPPFSYKDGDTWRGLNIDILNTYSLRHNTPITYTEYGTVSELLKAVEDDNADIAAGSISITQEREEKFLITKRYATSGLAIAVPKSSLKIDYLATFKNSGILTTLYILAAVIFVGGMLIWVAEHNLQDDVYIHTKKHKGLGQGLWWALSAVFAAPLDLVQPKSKAGKTLALGISIFSVFSLSIITAQFATALTTTKLSSNIHTLNDLRGKNVFVIGNANPEKFLKSKGLDPQTVQKPADLYSVIKSSQADAIVHDLPLLKYQEIIDTKSNISIVGEPLNEEDYGFVLNKSGASTHMNLNLVILDLQVSGELKEMSARYFKK